MDGSPAKREVEFLRHDSDDEAVVTIDGYCSAYDLRVGMESPNPQPVAQDHFVRVPGLVLIRKNVAS
jgi:hypothetical protein